MSWFTRFRNAVSPRRLDEDLADELRDHIERRAADLTAQGVAPDEARRRAAAAFGNVTRLQEQSRDFHLWTAFESTLQDIRYALRGMRKSPGFTATAILSLSLAIGANTAIYSIVDAAILRPLPVPDPGSLIMLAWPNIDPRPGGTGEEREAFSYPVYQQFRRDAGSSARLGLASYPSLVEAQIPDASAPIEHPMRQYVSGDLFEILNIPPALGRVFSSSDDRTPGGHPFVVISHDYWRRRFNLDPAVVGKTIRLGDKSYFIVGVARAAFFGVEPGKFVDIWLPAMMAQRGSFTASGWSWFRIVGRLAPGTSFDQLASRLQPAFHESQVVRIQSNPTLPPAITKRFLDSRLHVHSAVEGVSQFRRDFARPLWIVLAVAAGILLIACANLANLLLARANARSSEMAMRISLGAGRSRLVRQLLTESLILSVAAGAAGWLLAQAASPLLVSMFSLDTDPLRFALLMDARVLLFCSAVSTLAAVVFGLLPAWQASGAQPMSALRGVQGQAGKLRLGRFFVAVQVAFAFCLVIAGAGFLYSLRNLFAVDTGFDPRGVAVLDITTEIADEKQDQQREIMAELCGRLASAPGIQGAASSSWAIFAGSSWTDQVLLPGRLPSEREEIYYRISPGYFATLRTPLVAGRDFDAHDRDHTKGSTALVPAIVNQAFARRYFEGENPIGKIVGRPQGRSEIRHQIVGLASDTHYSDLRGAPGPIIYVPIDGTRSFSLYVRSTLDIGSVAKLVDRETKALGSGTRVREITTLETLVGNTILKEKLLAGIGGTFAALGLLLAAIGLFGLLNYSVARRTKEIGIRAALGANRGEIVALVWRDLLAMVGGGLAAGLAGSIAVMTVLQSLLFGIRPADPVVLATASAVFLVAVILAGTIPATRAASVDPMVALRHE
ncbi:MAG: ABC transporter permease [Bryobacteraceae bacterium]